MILKQIKIVLLVALLFVGMIVIVYGIDRMMEWICWDLLKR